MVSGAPSQAELSFLHLTHLTDRITVLLDQEVSITGNFYDISRKAFKVVPELERASVTSTCFVMAQIVMDPSQWLDVIDLPGIKDTLLAGEWDFASFQTPVVLATLLKMQRGGLAVMGESSPPTLKEKFLAGMNFVLDNRLKLGMHGRRTKVSTYVSYWNTLVLLLVLEVRETTLCENDMTRCIPDEVYSSITSAVKEALNVSADELCRQMAYHSAGDYSNFDIIKMAYSLLTHQRIIKSPASFQRSQSALTTKVREKALDIVFSEQRPGGLWDAGQAIYNGGGRDVGNSYAFSFDMLSVLLGTFNDFDLTKYASNLESSLKWAEENLLQRIFEESCDLESRKVTGQVLAGWRSNHLQSDTGAGPECWSTAQVFTALKRMRRVLKSCLFNDILQEFGEGKSTLTGPNLMPWDRLMDSDLDLGGGSAGRTTLKKVVTERVLDPMAEEQKRQYYLAQSRGVAAVPIAYSSILFGPPGTAKTTTAKAIAAALGWSFLSIDTSDFLADGFANVASRMSYVFGKLSVLERTVILFDEIEEFCLDREDKSLSMQSRMLTTAMLTLLNDLRALKKCIFLVATNRLPSFDSAITRPGRIDLVLFVGTPGLQARKERLLGLVTDATEQEKGTKLSTELQLLVDLACKFMDEKWEDDLQFFNFSENEGFLASVVGLIMVDKLTEEALAGILSNRTRTTTIR
ncbi:unnamed protein product [Chrysoparadoxa australica]